MALDQEDAEEVLHSSVDATPVDGDEFEEGTGSGSHAQTPSPSSKPVHLQPPSTGQVPGCSSIVPGCNVGRGRGCGRGGATPATAARRAGKHPIRDTNNGQVDESMHDMSHTTTPMDEDGDHVIVSDDEEEDDVEEVEVLPSKRKLTSKVWLEMKKMRINGEWKAKCNWCHKVLTAGSKNGTKHLRLHLDICTLKKLKTKGGKILSQSSLKVSAEEDGKVSMESYTFDQYYARVELGNMLMLHDYPLSMVDHVGFRRFVAALQPLFKLHTRNTIRGDIVGRYKMERKKAIEYMSMIQSRVDITTGMWTSDS
ncbi:zinc finger BED domain-containing protein RICESLEEPER 2-like [Aegilops tauschii subsp. strangulata]|uniref:zinc finger BED domain-containing protein RICESLEEPER 2-like n=1 Tax=Aegilops tauschii subsp. strangulata TaxID=200361 RepID=UPI003CC85481